VIMKADINKFCLFLNQRGKSMSFLQNIDLGSITNNKVTVFAEHNLWQIDEKHLFQQTCENNSYLASLLGFNDIGPVSVRVVDIKDIHKPVQHENSDRMNIFFDQLMKNGTMESFACPAVKALIEVRWATIWWKMIVFIVAPYVLFLLLFSTYTILDLISEETAETHDKEGASYGISIALIILILYFLSLEVAQLIRGNVRKQIANPWNLVNTLVMVLMLITEIALIEGRNDNHFGPDSTLEQQEDARELIKRARIFYSYCAVLVWFRVLYFFRIFRSTGYYIRMIMEVLSDMWNFMLIFIVVICAFANAFLLLGMNNSSGATMETFGQSILYTYYIPIGNAGDEVFPDYFREIASFFYILASFLLNIMLLNLLISVIQDTFNTIKQSYEVIMYKDMVGVINENRLFYWGDISLFHRGAYLFYTIPTKPDENLSKENTLNL